MLDGNSFFLVLCRSFFIYLFVFDAVMAKETNWSEGDGSYIIGYMSDNKYMDYVSGGISDRRPAFKFLRFDEVDDLKNALAEKKLHVAVFDGGHSMVGIEKLTFSSPSVRLFGVGALEMGEWVSLLSEINDETNIGFSRGAFSQYILQDKIGLKSFGFETESDGLYSLFKGEIDLFLCREIACSRKIQNNFLSGLGPLSIDNFVDELYGEKEYSISFFLEKKELAIFLLDYIDREKKHAAEQPGILAGRKGGV